MQTFLPYADFARSAAVLDHPRLGKQRVETLQILQVLLRLRWDNTAGVIEAYLPKGWRTHPVVLMWQGYETGLAAYQRAVCDEWVSRGFADSCRAKTDGLLAVAHDTGHESGTAPPWLGDEALHRSHQSNLVRKSPEVYGPLFPGVPDDLPYVWPVSPPRTEQPEPTG